jgi:diguanylate cyclase (GGDEF)-like protein
MGWDGRSWQLCAAWGSRVWPELDPRKGWGVTQIDESSEVGEVREAVSGFDLITVANVEQCMQCTSCTRHCPAHAIRTTDGLREIIAERCVSCGACVVECHNAGFAVRDDLPRVRELLASGRRVVVVLASEFVVGLKPLTPTQVEQRLEALGFAAVETTVLGEELVAAAYERVHGDSEQTSPHLRSTCPVAVSWVERFYPQLTAALVPIVPPYIAQARLVHAINPPDTSVVYVSPCWARKDEAGSEKFGGAVDVVIGFDELRRLMDENPCSAETIAQGEAASRFVRRPRPVKQLSLIDGFPRCALSERDMTDSDMVVVRGLHDIDRVLSAIVRGEIAPRVVDMLNCEGCIDGPAIDPMMSVFAKRNLIAAERERQPPPVVDSRTFLSALPAIDLARSFVPTPVASRIPAPEEIDAVLEAGEFASRSEVIDCGACGFDRCVELAAAICLGDATWERCFPLQRKRMQRANEELAEFALADPLTGLGNRRSLDSRLAAEVARAGRYHTSLSLAMVDLDGFKEVNDRYGHVGGDVVLTRVGRLMGEVMRASDISTRYGGDEFAIILPDTGKTAAWLAAEKLRVALVGLMVELPDGHEAGVTASIGVASYGDHNGTATELLEAADSALYEAKHHGRNRVELAAG